MHNIFGSATQTKPSFGGTLFGGPLFGSSTSGSLFANASDNKDVVPQAEKKTQKSNPPQQTFNSRQPKNIKLESQLNNSKQVNVQNSQLLEKEQLEFIEIAEEITIKDIKAAQKIIDQLDKETTFLQQKMQNKAKQQFVNMKTKDLMHKTEQIMDRIQARLSEFQRLSSLASQSIGGCFDLRKSLQLLQDVKNQITVLVSDNTSRSTKFGVIEAKIEQLNSRLRQ